MKLIGFKTHAAIVALLWMLSTGALPVAHSQTPVDLTMLNGELARVQFVEIDSGSLIVARGSAGTPEMVSSAELQKVTFDASDDAKRPDRAGQPQSQIMVELVDGSIFRANSFMVRSRVATLELAGGGSASIQTRNIQHVLLRSGPWEEELRDRWNEIVESPLEADVVVVRKTVSEGEDEYGVPKQNLTLAEYEGIIQDIDAATVSFKFDDQEIAVKRERLHGLIYFHARGRTFPEALCALMDQEGNRLFCRSIKSTKDQQLEVVTTSGGAFRLPLPSVQELDFSLGKIVYLSDLSPIAASWQAPLSSSFIGDQLEQLFRFRVDQNLYGKPLQLFVELGLDAEINEQSDLGGSKVLTFAHGLSARAKTHLVYQLPGDYSHLLAQVGIDPMVRPNGDVRLVIRGDGQILFESRITGQDDEPLALDLPIKGVRRISIEVDHGDQLGMADHLNLCDIRVVQ